MSDAIFQRSRSFETTSEIRTPRPLATGYGLLVGAAVSSGIWAGLAWLGAWLFA